MSENVPTTPDTAETKTARKHSRSWGGRVRFFRIKLLPIRRSARRIKARTRATLLVVWQRLVDATRFGRAKVRVVIAGLVAEVVWLGTHVWSWQWVAGIALSSIGIGGSAMFSGYFKAARALIYFGVGLLAGKAISEAKSQQRAQAIFIILFLGVVVVLGIEFMIHKLEPTKQTGRDSTFTERSNSEVRGTPTPQPQPSPSPPRTLTCLPVL